jgi:hypothetical protein
MSTEQLQKTLNELVVIATRIETRMLKIAQAQGIDIESITTARKDKDKPALSFKNQIAVTDWLKRNANLPDDAELYFDDVDLIFEDAALMGALLPGKYKIEDLLNFVKDAK